MIWCEYLCKGTNRVIESFDFRFTRTERMKICCDTWGTGTDKLKVCCDYHYRESDRVAVWCYSLCKGTYRLKIFWDSR